MVNETFPSKRLLAAVHRKATGPEAAAIEREDEQGDAC